MIKHLTGFRRPAATTSALNATVEPRRARFLDMAPGSAARRSRAILDVWGNERRSSDDLVALAGSQNDALEALRLHTKRLVEIADSINPPPRPIAA